MAKPLSKATNDFREQLGSTEPGAEALTETSAAILRVVGEFISDCETNLRKADRVSTGSLTDSIRPEVVQAGVNNIVDVYINSYYKFVDKGVRGWRDKKGSGSPYAFKAPGQAKTGQSKMVTAIRKWVIKEGIKGRNTKVAVTPREIRRAKITDTSTKEAIKIAESGLNNPETLVELKKAGFNGFLIGEYFMAQENTPLAAATFMHDFSDKWYNYKVNNHEL
jgi:hypothetical protein